MNADVHALSGAYVLDALPDDEKRAFEAHIADCATCRAEVSELREATARLATVVEEAPPPHLRANVLGAAERTRQDSPLRTLVTRSEPRRWTRMVLAPAAALVLFLVATLGITSIRAGRRAGQLETQLAAVAEGLTATDARTVSLAGDARGNVTVVVSPERGAGAVVATGLAQVASDELYTLWLIDSDDPEAMVTFAPAADGTAVVALPAPDMGAAQGFGVTVEEASSDLEAPAGPILFHAEVEPVGT